MNANLKRVLPALLAAATLSACSVFGDKSKSESKPAPAPAEQAAAQTPQNLPEPPTVNVDSIDARKEVAYKCGEESLSVMYGMKNNEVVVAQVKYREQVTPGLFRVTANTNDQNAFWGQGIAWIAGKADASNVDKVDGNMLTLRGAQTVNGKPQLVDQIVVKGCVLDKAATAKLNKSAAAKPASKGAKGKK